MTDHDRLFKELLTTFFGDFLRLFVPDLAAEVVLESVEPLPKEFFNDLADGRRWHIDILARLNTRAPLAGAAGASLVFVHVENQASREPEFARRLFHYFIRLVARHGEAVYPVGLFSYDSPGPVEPSGYEITLPGLDVMRFRFQVIQLARLRWRDFLDRPNPVAAALMSKVQIAEGDQPRVKAACLRMLAGLGLDEARTHLVSGFVDSYLRLDEAGETLFRSEIASADPEEGARVMEIVTSWQLKGREEGRSLGRVEAMLRVVEKQLAHRLGTLPPAVADRIRALPVEALEELAEALLEFESASDLDRWLSAHA